VAGAPEGELRGGDAAPRLIQPVSPRRVGQIRQPGRDGAPGHRLAFPDHGGCRFLLRQRQPRLAGGAVEPALHREGDERAPAIRPDRLLAELLDQISAEQKAVVVEQPGEVRRDGDAEAIAIPLQAGRFAVALGVALVIHKRIGHSTVIAAARGRPPSAERVGDNVPQGPATAQGTSWRNG
jgi:hypothetical protein